MVDTSGWKARLHKKLQHPVIAIEGNPEEQKLALEELGSIRYRGRRAQPIVDDLLTLENFILEGPLRDVIDSGTTSGSSLFQALWAYRGGVAPESFPLWVEGRLQMAPGVPTLPTFDDRVDVWFTLLGLAYQNGLLGQTKAVVYHLFGHDSLDLKLADKVVQWHSYGVPVGLVLTAESLQSCPQVLRKHFRRGLDA